MPRLIYYVFATSFAVTAISGVAMLVAPAPWLRLQKRLITYVSPPAQAEAFMRMSEVVPMRAMGAVYLLFGAAAFYALVSGAIPMPHG